MGHLAIQSCFVFDLFSCVCVYLLKPGTEFFLEVNHALLDLTEDTEDVPELGVLLRSLSPMLLSAL